MANNHQVANMKVDDDDDVQYSTEAAGNMEIDDDNTEYSIEVNDDTSRATALESNSINAQVHRRTLSHSPYPTEFKNQLIAAGLYGFMNKDITMCITCNLLCHEWVPGIDDPCVVHRILKPDCQYVKRKLRNTISRPPVTNTTLSRTVNVPELQIINLLPRANPTPYQEIVHKASDHSRYGIIERIRSFDRWPNRNSPSPEDLAESGFYYTGMNDAVTCFYCNGSLNNWHLHHDPKLEHVRFFPNCSYIRQLCGEVLYRQIQQHQRRQQGFIRA